MSEDFENDDLIERLRAEDPAAKADTEAPGEREAVRARVRQLLESGSGDAKRRHLRPRLVVAAVISAAAVAVVLGLTLGGSSSGPAPALAIEKTPKSVTLRLKNPNASDAQMNQELADAGIDRVRVNSVPGSPKATGTWAGYIELGPHCLGGVTQYGYDVDIPTVKDFNRDTKHGAEGQFDLTLPRHPGDGALTAQEVGTPGSKSIVRLPTDSIDDPRNAAKILVPVRPKSPDDPPDANDIGTDQLIALGGVFAEYGDAIQSGQTSCTDLGLTPFSKAPFPPAQTGWVVVDVTANRGGARRMTRELRSGGIQGKVRQIPVRRPDVGRYINLERVPPLPKHFDTLGNGSGAYNGADVVGNTNAHGPAQDDIALRLSAFNADPKDRWIIYVGRRTQPGEKAKVVGLDGVESQRAAQRNRCDGLVHVIGGKRGDAPPARGHLQREKVTLSPLRCESFPVLTVPGR